ncbi:glycosyl transferase group 1 [Whalleya microplaca]|nr:glycosyl transferase group 1 [Whalleya microplaca]
MTAAAHDLDVSPPALRGRRILICTESFGPVNGVSRTTLMLVNHLRTHGALVSVVAPYNHTKVNTFAAAKLDTVDRSYHQEVRVKGYPLPFNPELSVVYPVRLSELYRMTFGEPPDIIYLASPASLGFQVMLQLRLQAKELQVPIICNFQTDLAGYCSILFPWPLGGIASWVFAKVQGYLFCDSSVKTIFYPSTFVRKYLNGVAGVPDEKMEVLRRGVASDGFSPAKRSEELRKEWAPNGELILFTCSRLAGEKGFKFLSQAALELDKRGLDFKLVIVGGNRNSAVEQEVIEMFEPLREKGKVIFTGFRVGEALMTHYASADIFLHCSITETFGLVVLEAMASGVPVIARDEGGPSDIIEHGKTGYLIPPQDLEMFVQKVLQLGHDSKLREHISEAGRAAACEARWDRIGNKVAWKMVDIIEKPELVEAPMEPAAVNGRLPPSAVIRRFLASRTPDIKTTFGLFIILAFWAAVGPYLLFAKLMHLVKTRTPRIHAAVKSIF